MSKLTRQQKRRAYEAKRRERRREAKTRMLVNDAAWKAKEEGRKEGFAQGAAAVKDAVLENAGRLYKEGKDSDAAAVRDVHRRLA